MYDTILFYPFENCDCKIKIWVYLNRSRLNESLVKFNLSN